MEADKLAGKISLQIKKEIGKLSPEIGLVLGSGWGEFVRSIENAKVISYSSLTGMPTGNVKGHKDRFILGYFKGKAVCAMQGRIHAYEGYSADMVALPIRVMAALGIKTIILTTSCGGVNPEYKISDIIAIKDHLNRTPLNPIVGVMPTEKRPVFVDMRNAYDRKINKKLIKETSKKGIVIKEGVFAQTLGPTYETPIEIREMRQIGIDLVSMSTALEVIMAKYLGLRVVGLGIIANECVAENEESEKELCHEEVLEVATSNRPKIKIVLETLMSIL